MMLLSATPGSNLLTQAQALGDQETRQVGLLPYAAWDDYAAAGHILVATDEFGIVLGYVAYRVPRDEVRIAQLVVRPEARGRGVARTLLEALQRVHADRRGVGLRCRRDWEANSAWPKLGFASMGERPGRSAAGSILTEWWLDFGHPDLMSWVAGETETAAVMDVNVFLDLHGYEGSRTEETRQVLESLSDRLDLVVSPELFNELNRREDPVQRQRLTRIANSYPILKADPTRVDEWFLRLIKAADVRNQLTAQNRSDVRHVAWAAACGASIVLTRDERASKRFRLVARQLADITICHPGSLPAVLHERETAGAYAPAALAGTQFETQEISDKPGLAASFLDHGASERRNDFDRRLRDLAASRPSSSLRLIRDTAGAPRALLGTKPDQWGMNVATARLKHGLLGATLAAHMVDAVRRAATELGQSVMVVTDPLCPDRLRKAFRADGFVDTAAGLVGLALDARITVDDLEDQLKAVARKFPVVAPLVASFGPGALPAVTEHALRPLRLTDANLPTWIVPIRRQWASDLFGYPSMLIPRDDELGLAIEHVYYKRGLAGETSPGRVLWYMSGSGCEVFGCSLLTEVRDASPEDLFARYRRLGVFTLADVQACKRRDGTVRALNVTDTEIFRRPVGLRKLRELAASSGQALQLQGASRVSAELFGLIIKEAQDC